MPFGTNSEGLLPTWLSSRSRVTSQTLLSNKSMFWISLFAQNFWRFSLSAGNWLFLCIPHYDFIFLLDLLVSCYICSYLQLCVQRRREAEECKWVGDIRYISTFFHLPSHSHILNSERFILNFCFYFLPTFLSWSPVKEHQKVVQTSE